jgi:hypothetical protein
MYDVFLDKYGPEKERLEVTLNITQKNINRLENIRTNLYNRPTTRAVMKERYYLARKILEVTTLQEQHKRSLNEINVAIHMYTRHINLCTYKMNNL